MQRLLGPALFLACLGLATPLLWGLTETGIKLTSDYDFCGSCHSMEPMVSSYLKDTHGGNNSAGIRATCSDCHLPHTSSFTYLRQKAVNGVWDVWVEYLAGAEDIDWQAKRVHRESFTYSSGCLRCHSNLATAPVSNTKTWVAHRPLFQGEVQATCVSCHEHVGHHQLTSALQQHFQQQTR